MSRASELLDKIGEAGEYKPIPSHPFHSKTNAELHYIMRDAHQAAKAMQGHNPQAEGKYLDQANDAATVLGYRRRAGGAFPR